MVFSRAGVQANGELFTGHRISVWEGEQILALGDSDGPHKDVN